MPVVWCKDPNSSSKKPTAFALQGIQLQGNISKEHVLAVRELVNAAAEGRLLLPTDGGIVLLDCGVGVGSVVIQDSNCLGRESHRENKESRTVIDVVQQKKLHKIRTDVELKKRQKKEFESYQTRNDMLYEFLCCANCMNEGVKCCSRNNQSLKIVAKFIDDKLATGRVKKRPARQTNSRCKNTVSFKRPLRKVKASVIPNKIPIYATVNKQLKKKNNKNDQIVSSEIEKAAEIIAKEVAQPISSTLRKTSFDSTCTVSSMDSGFMDMQNKLELAKIAKNVSETVEIKIDECKEMNESVDNLPRTWNRLTIPSQSRNRRKSYEEFKSLFFDKPSSDSNRLDVKNSSKSRRKSHEEFKSEKNIVCDSNLTNNCKSSSNANTNELVIANDCCLTPLSEENSSNLLTKMKRKNSKRVSARKSKFINKPINEKIDEDTKTPVDVTGSTIYDILRKKTSNNYDKNLELFKSHCNKNNIKDFDNFLSCGTIYDIIQRKSDLYTKNFKRWDKYMTYGTLYEILHKKTDEGDQFERKRTLSEKFSNKRINYAHIDFEAPAANDNDSKTVQTASDTNSRNLNSSGSTTCTNSMEQGSGSANNQLSITSLGSQQLSTIYDILQTKKLDATPEFNDEPSKGRNRFLVRKITEEDLIKDIKEVESAKTEYCQPIVTVEPVKKQNRMRRFSNILSYSPKASHENDSKLLKVPTPHEGEMKTNVHLEAKIDELYSRLNRITQQKENLQLSKPVPEKESSKIYKSSSLDNVLSALNENEVFVAEQRQIRKISVPAKHTVKTLPRKNTRRLSEFTRGEFLNEKSWV